MVEGAIGVKDSGTRAEISASALFRNTAGKYVSRVGDLFLFSRFVTLLLV